MIVAGVLAGAALSLFFPLQVTGASVSKIDIQANNERFVEVEKQLPYGELHWHAQLKIFAAGSFIAIPGGIGVTIGKNIDNGVSGKSAAPMHTHEDGNTLHIENVAPRLNQDKLTLGYFFSKVWGKKFDNECIFEYCNGAGGTVKLFVNGKQSTQFENYSLRDGDQILIVYSSP